MVHDLIKSLKSGVKDVYLVITKTQSDGDVEVLRPEIEKTGLQLIGVVPMDPMVTEFDLQSRPLFELSPQSAAVQAVSEICRKAKI